MSEQVIANFISAAIGVTALIGLWIQSHSTRKQVKLQNFVEYTKRYQEIMLNLPENVNSADFSLDELDEEVKNKTMRYMRAYLDLCFEEYTLQKLGFIDDDLWTIWKGGMDTAFGKIAFKQAWQKIQLDTEYGDEFNKFAKDLGIAR